MKSIPTNLLRDKVTQAIIDNSNITYNIFGLVGGAQPPQSTLFAPYSNPFPTTNGLPAGSYPFVLNDVAEIATVPPYLGFGNSQILSVSPAFVGIYKVNIVVETNPGGVQENLEEITLIPNQSTDNRHIMDQVYSALLNSAIPADKFIYNDAKGDRPHIVLHDDYIWVLDETDSTSTPLSDFSYEVNRTSNLTFSKQITGVEPDPTLNKIAFIPQLVSNALQETSSDDYYTINHTFHLLSVTNDSDELKTIIDGAPANYPSLTVNNATGSNLDVTYTPMLNHQLSIPEVDLFPSFGWESEVTDARSGGHTGGLSSDVDSLLLYEDSETELKLTLFFTAAQISSDDTVSLTISGSLVSRDTISNIKTLLDGYDPIPLMTDPLDISAFTGSLLVAGADDTTTIPGSTGYVYTIARNPGDNQTGTSGDYIIQVIPENSSLSSQIFEFGALSTDTLNLVIEINAQEFQLNLTGLDNYTNQNLLDDMNTVLAGNATVRFLTFPNFSTGFAISPNGVGIHSRALLRDGVGSNKTIADTTLTNPTAIMGSDNSSGILPTAKILLHNFVGTPQLTDPLFAPIKPFAVGNMNITLPTGLVTVPLATTATYGDFISAANTAMGVNGTATFDGPNKQIVVEAAVNEEYAKVNITSNTNFINGLSAITISTLGMIPKTASPVSGQGFSVIHTDGAGAAHFVALKTTNPSDLYKISVQVDGGAAQVVTITDVPDPATSALVSIPNIGWVSPNPFDVEQTLLVSIDGGADQSVVANSNGSGDIDGTETSTGIATALDTALTGVTVSQSGGEILFFSDTTGTSSSVEFSGDNIFDELDNFRGIDSRETPGLDKVPTTTFSDIATTITSQLTGASAEIRNNNILNLSDTTGPGSMVIIDDGTDPLISNMKFDPFIVEISGTQITDIDLELYEDKKYTSITPSVPVSLSDSSYLVDFGNQDNNTAVDDEENNYLVPDGSGGDTSIALSNPDDLPILQAEMFAAFSTGFPDIASVSGSIYSFTSPSLVPIDSLIQSVTPPDTTIAEGVVLSGTLTGIVYDPLTGNANVTIDYSGVSIEPIRLEVYVDGILVGTEFNNIGNVVFKA